MSVSPCLKLNYAGHYVFLFVLISDQSHTLMIQYNSAVCNLHQAFNDPEHTGDARVRAGVAPGAAIG